MADYDVFGNFYDAIMGDRAKPTKRLLKFIRNANPKAKTILELGCGTGSVLKHLAKNYDVSGVDRSRTMLSIARKKVPGARLSRQNMVRFRLRETFDVICCVYDSINHVLSFDDWKRLFANVDRHLPATGAFIFDINTQRKLDRHIAERPWVHKFGNNLLIMKVTAARNKASNWNIKIFERTKGKRYLLHEENIKEASFPVWNIVNALRAHFRRVEVIDPDRNRPSSKSERLYFVCKK
jgi:SAM-dependent methyltransferase